MLKSLISGMPVGSARELSADRSRTVCITGHREKNILPYRGDPVYTDITVGAVKMMLYRYIDMAAERGYTDFISGLATGADLWAAEYIVRKKQTDPRIRLIGAMPYLRHAERFPRDYAALLDSVERAADVLVTVNETPDIVYSKQGEAAGLYRDRNYFMVDRSSAVIAFLNEGSFASGTSQTVNYAYRNGRLICRFGIDDVYALIDRAGADLRSIRRETAFLNNVFDIAP
ncbi:MAG: SLOG family protein [Ruminococcus sp.]|nr:SLOG family protein [Ruminococcus sp.]